MSPPKSINHYDWPIKNNKHQLFLIYLFIYLLCSLFQGSSKVLKYVHLKKRSESYNFSMNHQKNSQEEDVEKMAMIPKKI
jgi:hypothetical protein